MTGGELSSLSWPRIAVLGAGHTGPVIARVALEAGYQVSIAASGDPEKIELITKVLAPGAEPRWAADAVMDADLVVLAIPLHKFAAFDSALVAGKLVVDTMNYWPPIDGVQEMFEDRQYGSGEIVAHRLARSTIVETLNHNLKTNADLRARRNAACSALLVTTQARWASWRKLSSGSATTPSDWTV
jgi:8-hydroxy-5-deazaflavin:NADPH oxidoreductase